MPASMLTDLEGFFIIRRSGTFNAVPSGDHHCGTGTSQFRYECKVLMKGLDARGFGIDNDDIVGCVECSVMGISCELHAIRTAKTIKEKVKEAGMLDHLLAIKVTIGAMENGDATFIYKHKRKRK